MQFGLEIHSSFDLGPNGIPFSAKSVGMLKLQAKFGSIQLDSEWTSLW